MNKKEAIFFIKSELEKGTPEGEIIETLMSQDKISNKKPTLEHVALLMIEAKRKEGESSDAPPAAPKQKPSGCNYEKWKVDVRRQENGEIVSIEKNKMLKEVRIDEETAERMNTALMTSDKGYAIYFYPKQ